MIDISVFKTLFILFCAIIGLSSALPVNVSMQGVNKQALTGVDMAIGKNKINQKRLQQSGYTWQERKLTFKERIGVKIFGKKIIYKLAAAQRARPGEKSPIVALVLGFLPMLIWIFGLHRFYLGYTWQGLAQLITFGGCGVWWLIDMVRIISGDLKPRVGEYDE